MTVHSAKPKVGVGAIVTYRDRQKRIQTGKVFSIEAKWNYERVPPSVTYRVGHPTATHGYVYIGNGDML